jgi:hypothetical protein
MHTLNRLGWLVTVGLSLVGCGSGKATDQTCPTGWWTQQTSGACSICTASGSNPECGRADCVQIAVEGFRDARDEFSGIVTYSKEAGTISSVGDIVKRTYVQDSGTIHIDGTNRSSLAVCDGSRLRWDYASQVRASSELAGALDRGTANGSPRFRAARLTP